MFHLFKNRRAQLLKLTWQGRSLGGSLPDWALNTLGPTCVFNAKRVIRKLEKRDGFYEVEFKNVPGKLYAPVAMSEFELHQIIAEQFYAWNWHQYQIPQTTIAPGDYVFDCGCCEGLFPFLNHQRAGKFICFEPLEPYRQGLAKTFVDTPNVIVVPEALGDQPERVYFLDKTGIGALVSSTPTSLQVDVTTIDLYCQATGYPMNYLKVDVEGYDLKVLRGAAATIRKYRPKIAIATYHASSHAAEMRAFLLSLIPDYQILTKGWAIEFGTPVLLHAW